MYECHILTSDDYRSSEARTDTMVESCNTTTAPINVIKDTLIAINHTFGLHKSDVF
jgi:hypothetical protein